MNLFNLIVFLSLVGLIHAQSDYIECIEGNLNVILSAPHGGYEEPSEIQDRDAGCFIDGECVWDHECGEKDEDECGASVTRDSFTLELTELIAEYLENMTGLKPTSVINHLHRVKLDANRDINEATFGEPLAVEAWEEYHRCINESKQRIEANEDVNGMGLFLDIHGHGHPNVWAELGYLLSGSDLDSPDSPESSDTAIYHLSTQTSAEFENLLRGDTSYGYFMEQEGYEAVPSPTNPGPDGDAYFSGGYNTRIHGSRDGGTIDAIQIESAFENRDDPERERYAAGIATATLNYLLAHYPNLSSMRKV